MEDNEPIKGKFYEAELSLVRGYLQREQPIEKILKERTRNKKKQCLVRWLGLGPEHDSWVDKKCMKLTPST
jgi:hypothetical protein